MKLTEGKGVNLILEMLANVNLGKDLKVLATHGRVVVIGSRGPPWRSTPRDNHAPLRGHSGDVAALRDRTRTFCGSHRLGRGAWKNGSLKPVIGKEIPLAQAAQAQEDITKAGAYGKNRFSCLK